MNLHNNTLQPSKPTDTNKTTKQKRRRHRTPLQASLPRHAPAPPAWWLANPDRQNLAPTPIAKNRSTAPHAAAVCTSVDHRLRLLKQRNAAGAACPARSPLIATPDAAAAVTAKTPPPAPLVLAGYIFL